MLIDQVSKISLKLSWKVLVSALIFSVLGVGAVFSTQLEITETRADYAPRTGISDLQNQDNPGSWQVEAAAEVEGTNSKSGNKGFTLQINKIGLKKAVVENVDPIREAVYGPVINNYVAHGRYTRLPDEATKDGNVYLFAHRQGSADGRDIGFFSRLGEIAPGDQATITYAGKIYTYQMYDSFIISPEDTWAYTGASRQPTLTLQTCENGEASRLIVKFKLVGVAPL